MVMQVSKKSALIKTLLSCVKKKMTKYICLLLRMVKTILFFKVSNLKKQQHYIQLMLNI